MVNNTLMDLGKESSQRLDLLVDYLIKFFGIKGKSILGISSKEKRKLKRIIVQGKHSIDSDINGEYLVVTSDKEYKEINTLKLAQIIERYSGINIFGDSYKMFIVKNNNDIPYKKSTEPNYDSLIEQGINMGFTSNRKCIVNLTNITKYLDMIFYIYNNPNSYTYNNPTLVLGCIKKCLSAYPNLTQIEHGLLLRDLVESTMLHEQVHATYDNEVIAHLIQLRDTKTPIIYLNFISTLESTPLFHLLHIREISPYNFVEYEISEINELIGGILENILS